MPKKLIILVSCMCMLGTTMVPAYMIPCCCKTTYDLSSSTNKTDTQAAPSCCSAKHTIKHACCEGQSCPDTVVNVITEKCSKCRCLEHLQILALSGYLNGSSMESNYEMPELKTHVISSDISSHQSVLIPSLCDEHPIALLTLQTCTLRC